MTTVLPLTEAEIESSVIARWHRVMAHYADQVAVTTVAGERYTYAELDQASNRLAHALLDQLGPVNCPIILLLDHDYPLLVSLLGTLKAGKAYVAFDSSQAVGQLQLLYQSTAAPVIVTDQAHQALAQAIVSAAEQAGDATPTIWLFDALPATQRGTPDLPLTPDTLAGIFFTSGTISQPKGIARSHRIVLHRAWFGAGTYTFSPSDAISGIRQCGLGGGMADVFNALLYGATYCFYDLHQQGLQGLSAWLQRERITYFHPPIVLFRQWLETLAPGEFYPHLRLVLPSGRKSRADLERFWPHVPAECAILTSYSSTETTQITSTAVTRTTPLDDGVIHVGAPLPGKQVTVVDNDGQPATPGEVGEIVVRSRYIATGYWRQPTLTAQRFTPTTDGSGETIYRTGDFGRLRADGYLELIGRQDSQVKVRGYRVVLGEVEDALRALPGIHEAAVTANETRGQLYAYLIAATEPPTPPAAIRASLATRFPDYALPSHIRYLPTLPILPSGKIDRKALPAPPPSRPALAVPYTPPATATEAALVTLWEEILLIEGIGIYDSFFELGGHSLLAMRLIMAIQQKFGQLLPIRAFAQQPTIAQLASHLDPTAPRQAIEPSARPEPSATTDELFVLRARRAVDPIPLSHWQRFKSRGLQTVAPYAWRARFLALGCRQRPLQQTHYRNIVQLIDRFYSTLEQPRLTRDATVQQSLMTKLWMKWGILRLHYTNQLAQLDRWFTVHGLAHLQEAVARQQGVILARSHTFFSQQAFFILEQQGFHPIFALGLGKVARIMQGKVDDDYLMAVRSHLLFQSAQVLQQGGLISILPDGHHGSREGITLPFHGRQRTFRTGFAELALDTGAAVVPIFVSSDLKGHIRVEFTPALTSQPTANRDEQVKDLVTQYATLLRKHWAAHPANVPWPQMRLHLALPQLSRSSS
ncbi:MAG: AMP-binding protein [Caldilineaceae bacterium]|nr:AMP-binding protein [Caldilineaceae bacterium]